MPWDGQGARSPSIFRILYLKTETGDAANEVITGTHHKYLIMSTLDAPLAVSFLIKVCSSHG